MKTRYKKLWKLLIDKDIKKGDLLLLASISSNIMSKMNKNENISTDSHRKNMYGTELCYLRCSFF